MRILENIVGHAISGMHVLRIERQKEAFQSCFSDVKNWIQQTSQNTVILRGALRRSRRINDPAMNPCRPGEGGPSQTVGEGLESVCFTAPHPP